ncbi:MAG: type II toxin-antitoxin system PemK/MazF family toxin [Fimbriimonadales bacterium]|nr:type II toxin-antitoxin system PemK/MazF family toxin [Fimbriimonadales bacterium]
MERGDIHWVELGEPRGHRQAGRRPAIVAQSQAFAEALPTVLMIPLTTRLEALRFPATILIEPDEQNGLRRPSVALVFQIAPVDKRYIFDRLGVISREQISLVESILRDLLEISLSEEV